MEPGEYDALQAKARGGSHAAATELLQAMKANKIHQPELVVLYGGRLLSSAPRSLGNEVWTVLEQVFMAAVELGMADWRDYCLDRLTRQFPGSHRVERLKGMRQESLEKWDDARATYEKMLKDKPEDAATRKRLIAVHKIRGSPAAAVKELNDYLDTFCVDPEAWHELAELYIDAGSLSRAVFCFEELLLINPQSMYNMLTYAELLYSTGDYELSRKYFSLVAYLDDQNLRALWGLALANAALVNKDKTNEKMRSLQNYAIDRLKAVYKKAGGGHSQAAIALLDAFVAPA